MAAMASAVSPSPRFGPGRSSCAILQTPLQRRACAVEEDPRDRQPDPDDEAEQADHVDQSETAEAFFPQLLEIGHDSDREKRHDEEKHSEDVALRRGQAKGGCRLRGAKSQSQ